MPTTLNSPPETASGNGTLEAFLAPIHDRWIERLAHVLAPAMVPRASFWERWGATRFLTDQFESQFALQCELAESLAGVMDPTARARLDAGRHDIDVLRRRLVAAGRRRGTAGPVAMLARQLIEQTRLWCAELETASSRITLDAVPEDSRELLGRLRDASELGW
jgi:hypothetical protein